MIRWVNRKDAEGLNIFEGGFLGLDNVGVFDRSRPLPTGGKLAQSDGTSWMAMFCLNMLNISLELARFDDTYEDVASKFWEHFIYISKVFILFFFIFVFFYFVFFYFVFFFFFFCFFICFLFYLFILFLFYLFYGSLFMNFIYYLFNLFFCLFIYFYFVFYFVFFSYFI